MKYFALILFAQVTIHTAVEPRILRNEASETARDYRLEKLLPSLIAPHGPFDIRIERYEYNRVDLNNDRTPELIVRAFGQEICGSAGCPTFILRRTSSGYAVVMDLELNTAPILVSKSRTNGWNDLVIFYRGYGTPGQYAVLEFNGTSYVARADNSAQAMPDAVAYLAGNKPNGGVRVRQ